MNSFDNVRKRIKVRQIAFKALFILLLIIAYQFIKINQEIQARKYSILLKQRDSLMIVFDAVQIELAEIISPENIIIKAKNLGFQQPKDGQLRIVPVETDDNLDVDKKKIELMTIFLEKKNKNKIKGKTFIGNENVDSKLSID